jgi:hypothetical protein
MCSTLNPLLDAVLAGCSYRHAATSWCEQLVPFTVQAVILGVGMTAAMMAVAMQSGTAGDLVS